MKTRVVYWNTIPSPYLTERFNAVADRGNLDFEAWFNARTNSERSWAVDEHEWRFGYRYLPSVGFGNRRLTIPRPILGDCRPDVLVSLYAEPSFLIGSTIARHLDVHTVFWSQVTFDTWVSRRRWKEAVKRFAFSRVDATFGSGQQSRAFAMRYGTHPERAIALPHVIDSQHFREGRVAALPERDAFRERLGLRGTTFVYVGRLWWGKGLGCLLDAFSSLQRTDGADVSLLVIGDGPEEQPLRRRCELEGIKNVVFAGFHQKPALPKYLAAADVFVFPTLGDPYGLVIDEAMASSLPVISTDASGEIHERIIDGIHGFIVSPADSGALMRAMQQLALDVELRARMGKAGAEKMVTSTPERWAIDFERAIARVMAG